MDDWPADETATITDCDRWCTALFWIVPAKVAGTWRLHGGELTLTQRFQNVSGTLKSRGETTPVVNGKLRGDRIAFTVGTTQYSGRVNGNVLEGELTTGETHRQWRATR
jgi:hypothetical protein